MGLLSQVLFLTDVQAAPKTNEESLDRIVATLNDAVITQSELDEATDRIKKQLAANHTPQPPADTLRKRVLDQLVERKLQLLIGEQAGVKVSDEDVSKVIAGIAHQNNMTEKELYEKLGAEGMTTSAYQKEIHDELVIQRIQQQEVGSHIKVSSQEVDDLLRSASWRAYNNKEYHLEDILITLPEAPTPQDVAEAKERANKVLAKIRKGMSFAEVSAAESGSEHALQGGDMGWLKLPQIPPAFADQLVHMQANGILGPIASPTGFHIIRLVALRDVTEHASVDEQYKQVQQLLYQRKYEEGLQSWLTRMRSEAFINTNPEKSQA
jgi:peptidyl-prolyl cis-trans isomerase SurA